MPQPSIEELAKTGLAWVIDHHRAEIPAHVAQALDQHQEYRCVFPRVTQHAPSLWHYTCNHRQYNVSCEQFDALLVAARFACQRCRQTTERLVIDHDHRLGWWAVRGLLCHWCNSLLGRVDNGITPTDPETERYLASPPRWRRNFDSAPIYGLATIVGRWERTWKVPAYLQIGCGNNAWMDWAIQAIREHGTNDRRIRPARPAA